MPRLVRNGALERGIQYAAPLQFDRDRPGVLDRPPPWRNRAQGGR
jgi:hypothetical protein